MSRASVAAVAKWRTSSLFRKVIALPALMAVVAVHGWAHYSGGEYVLAIDVAGAVPCLARIASLVRNARIRYTSTLQTAIGVRHPRVVQKAQGFMGSSFNTREFSHRRSRAVVQGVQWTFLALAFVVPVVLLLAGHDGRMLYTAAWAFAIQYGGLPAERWFFFAQANHPHNFYYQAAS